MKQKPKHSRIFARIEPKMAAWITRTFEFPTEVLSSTMKRMISTTDPKVVSITTAIDFW
jgi:hypothetical protein